MPDGVMIGNGSQETPYIIMDAYDFNEIRNLTTTSTDIAHLELGSDIDMSVYANWIPIPSGYFNFDGKNFTVYNVRSNNSSATGLFATITGFDYLQNVSVEGAFSSTNNNCGMFAATVNGRVGSVIDNIHCYGTVSGTVGTTSRSTGGVFGSINNDNQTIFTCNNCSYFGNATIRLINSTATTFGGIVGSLYTAYGTLYMTNCVSNVRLYINVNNASYRMYEIGGLVGETTSTYSPTYIFDSNIACIEFNLITTATNTANNILAGIVGYATGTVNISKCISFVHLNYNPSLSPNILRICGITGNTIGSISYSYSVMTFSNPNNVTLPTTFVYYGVRYNNSAQYPNCFFDLEMLRSTYDGTISDEVNGITTEELKDQSFLESKGWVF